MIEKQIKDEYRMGTRTGITELADCFYIPVRITGTGLSLRNKDGQVVVADRQKHLFTSAQALEHFATLPITKGHPTNEEGEGELLNSENLKSNPIIGNCISAYVKDEDVWGVARIFDKTLLDDIKSGKVNSTSPGVDLYYDIIGLEEKENEVPVSLNHLAFCERGHWDSPTSKGFDNSTHEEIIVKEEQAKNDSEVKEEVDSTKEDEVIDSFEEIDEDEVIDSFEEVDEDEVIDSFEEVDEDEVIDSFEEVDEDEVIDSFEEIDEDEAETEVIDSSEETEEDKSRDEATSKMRKACDEAHPSLGVVMPHIGSRQTLRSVVNKFVGRNRAFLDSKYRLLAIDSYTNELAREVLDSTLANIRKASSKLEKKRQQGFVDTGRGYSVDPEF